MNKKTLILAAGATLLMAATANAISYINIWENNPYTGGGLLEWVGWGADGQNSGSSTFTGEFVTKYLVSPTPTGAMMDQNGNLIAKSIVLRDADGTISDIVDMWLYASGPGTVWFTFTSDTEGGPALVPAGQVIYDIPESGLLDSRQVTLTGTSGSVTFWVSVQSDVPDGGTTAALLGFGITGLIWLRRKMRS